MTGGQGLILRIVTNGEMVILGIPLQGISFVVPIVAVDPRSYPPSEVNTYLLVQHGPALPWTQKLTIPRPEVDTLARHIEARDRRASPYLRYAHHPAQKR